MIDRSLTTKTFGELLRIFNAALEQMTPSQDKSNDFRISGFVDEMSKGNWKGDIIFEGNSKLEIQDGIHRGTAYLKCVENGISEKDLPKLIVIHEIFLIRGPSPSLGNDYNIA